MTVSRWQEVADPLQAEHDDVVIDYVRWVMVKKRDEDAPAPETVSSPA